MTFDATGPECGSVNQHTPRAAHRRATGVVPADPIARIRPLRLTLSPHVIEQFRRRHPERIADAEHDREGRGALSASLERLAALDGETVSAVLARELRDLVSVHSEWLSQEVPGFAEALAWPETPLVTSPRGGGAAGAPGTKQAASADETRGRTPKRSVDAGQKTEAAMFTVAAHRVTATDIDTVIH